MIEEDQNGAGNCQPLTPEQAAADLVPAAQALAADETKEEALERQRQEIDAEIAGVQQTKVADGGRVRRDVEAIEGDKGLGGGPVRPGPAPMPLPPRPRVG